MAADPLYLFRCVGSRCPFFSQSPVAPTGTGARSKVEGGGHATPEGRAWGGEARHAREGVRGGRTPRPKGVAYLFLAWGARHAREGVRGGVGGNHWKSVILS